MRAARHQIVHQVVTRCNGIEYTAHAAGFFAARYFCKTEIDFIAVVHLEPF